MLSCSDTSLILSVVVMQFFIDQAFSRALFTSVPLYPWTEYWSQKYESYEMLCTIFFFFLNTLKLQVYES